MKKDGGPAFPSIYGATDALDEGMSLRDYFAAHAPAHILWEFDVIGFADADRPSGYSMDWPYHTPATKKISLDMEKFDCDRTRAMYAQWPWVWADAMLAERERSANA